MSESRRARRRRRKTTPFLVSENSAITNGPFCHYCMGQGLGDEGRVQVAANGVLCMTHLNDPQLFGFYEIELEGADLTNQLTLEMQELIRDGFFDRGRAELNRTLRNNQPTVHVESLAVRRIRFVE